jgi:hypothetical protein
MKHCHRQTCVSIPNSKADLFLFCRFWRYQDDIPTPSTAAKHPLTAAQDDAATLAAAGILR